MHNTKITRGAQLLSKWYEYNYCDLWVFQVKHLLDVFMYGITFLDENDVNVMYIYTKLK